MWHAAHTSRASDDVGVTTPGLLSALDPINRRMGDVECVYVMDFFKMLWKGEI